MKTKTRGATRKRNKVRQYRSVIETEDSKHNAALRLALSVLTDKNSPHMQRLAAMAEERGLSPEETAQAMAALLADGFRHRWAPVGIREFILSPYYLNAARDGTSPIWPKVMDVLEEINSGAYDEVVATGSIGAAKSTIAIYSTVYQIYRLACLEDQQQEFGLDPASEIVLGVQSLTAKAAKAVDFQRIKALIDNSPFFREYYPYNPKQQAELQFPRNVVLRPLTGEATSSIGQNLIGGIIDEINFMKRVEASRKSDDGGVYDQAIALYNSISRRRKSRFMRQGVPLPGLLFLVSSKRYPGQFTDLKTQEAARDIAERGSTRIYIYDKRSWEIVPDDRVPDEWFNVFIGDLTRQPRIMGPKESVKPDDQALVLRVPEGYRRDFERDMMMALRDIGGVSTLARHPYFTRADRLAACFTKPPPVYAYDAPTKYAVSVLDLQEAELSVQKLKVLRKRLHRPEEPRWVHIDIGITGDALGMACAYVPDAVEVDRGGGIVEARLRFHFDFLLRVVPPKGGEIELWRVRRLLLALRDRFGLNIRWVSFDSYQSRDSIQQLRQEGFKSDLVSMDKNCDAYDIAKEAFYDLRVRAPYNERALRELQALEYIADKGKVDHPPHGSKDLADAVAGCIYGLSMRRELYIRHGVPVNRIPTSLAGVAPPSAQQRRERDFDAATVAA